MSRPYDWLFATDGRRRGFLVFLYLILCLIIADVLRYNYKDRRDFHIFLDAASKVLAGVDIYPPDAPTVGSYLYLPLFAILLAPFTLLPPIVSVLIWTVINIALTWWIITAFFQFMTGFPIRSLEARDRFTIYFLTVLPTFDFLFGNLRNGQTNIFVLAIVIAALVLYGKGREVGSGLLLGVAAVLKVFSLPLAFWMLLRGKLKVVAGTLGGILFGLFVPVLMLGWYKNLGSIVYWFQHVAVRHDTRDHVVPFHHNTSFEAVLFRVFSDVPAFSSYHNEYKVTLLIVRDDYIHAGGLALVILLAGSLVLYWARFRNGPRLIVESGGPVLALLCAPLLTLVSEKYHFVFLLPAYLYLAVLWKVYNVRDRMLFVLAGASFCFGTLTLKPFWGDYYSKVWFAYGCVIFAAILLACAVFRAATVLSRTSEGRIEGAPFSADEIGENASVLRP